MTSVNIEWNDDTGPWEEGDAVGYTLKITFPDGTLVQINYVVPNSDRFPPSLDCASDVDAFVSAFYEGTNSSFGFICNDNGSMNRAMITDEGKIHLKESTLILSDELAEQLMEELKRA